MDLKNLAILISAGINLFLGFFIYLKGRTKLVNRTYGLIALSVFYWAIDMVLYRVASGVESSLFWCKILYTAPIFIVSSFLFFSFIFPEEQKKISKKITVSIFAVCGVIFYLTLFTNAIVKGIVLNPGEEKTIIFGNLYFVYSIFISGFFIWSYINLLIKKYKSAGIFRAQVTYVFWGTFLASTLSMVTNLLLPTFGNFYFNWAGQILSLIMVVFIAYAIVVHRLMDIKLVMRRSTVYLASVLTVFLPAVLVLYLADRFYPNLIIFSSLAITVLAVTVFPPIRGYFYRLANKYFFSSLYDSGEVISFLSDRLRSTLEAAY